MTRPKLMLILGSVLVLLVGYLGSSWNTASSNDAAGPSASPTNTETADDNSDVTPQPTAIGQSNDDSSSNIINDEDYAAYKATSSASTTTVTEAQANNKASHEDAEDYT